MELMHQWEEGLIFVIEFLKVALETIATICVFIGLIKIVTRVFAIYRHRTMFPTIQVRLDFGRWLALALEFQLGADIIATTIAPTYADLGKLAVVALIRTFLNYFLAQELDKEYEFQQKNDRTVQTKKRRIA